MLLQSFLQEHFIYTFDITISFTNTGGSTGQVYCVRGQIRRHTRGTLSRDQGDCWWDRLTDTHHQLCQREGTMASWLLSVCGEWKAEQNTSVSEVRVALFLVANGGGDRNSALYDVSKKGNFHGNLEITIVKVPVPCFKSYIILQCWGTCRTEFKVHSLQHIQDG